MDSAKYFQNGLAELIEIWHTAKVFKFYHLIVFSIFNVIYFVGGVKIGLRPSRTGLILELREVVETEGKMIHRR
jgi:hypothetical protein